MSITTIIGPMFSGKTTELIRLIERKRLAGKKCLIIKHINDNRFDHIAKDTYHITTHYQMVYKKCDIIYLSELTDSSIDGSLEKYQVIGIDEGFFFKGIHRFCNAMANRGMEVIVATLDSSYKQEMFPEIAKLIAISENVIKLQAVCMRCGKDASFNIRTVESDKEILVGSSDKYMSVCRSCLNNLK